MRRPRLIFANDRTEIIIGTHSNQPGCICAHHNSPDEAQFMPPVQSHCMRKASLLYNPVSGRRKKHRLHDVEAAKAVLQAAGVVVEAAPTRGASDAAEQVRSA